MIELSIVARTPLMGGANVSVREPITLTFSRAVDLGTFSDDLIFLANAEGDRLAATGYFDEAGTLLTVTPTVRLIAPDTLTLTLSDAVRDLEGNSLLLKGAPANQWELPLWYNMDGFPKNEDTFTWPVSQLTAVGSEVYGLQADAPNGTFNVNVYLSRWDGGAWKRVGGAIDTVLADPVLPRALAALPDGTPIALIDELGGGTSATRLRQFRNGLWSAFGGTIDSGTEGLDVAVDTQGRPIVALRVPGTDSDLMLKRYEGGAWVTLGGGTLDATENWPSTHMHTATIAMDGDTPWVIVKAEALNNMLESVGKMTLLYKVEGASYEFPVTDDVMTVNPLLTIDGTFFVDEIAGVPQLTFDGDGTPYIAFSATGPDLSSTNQNAYVAKLEDGTWIRVGGDIDRFVAEQAVIQGLVVGASRQPMVVFEQTTATGTNLYASEWNESDGAWLPVGDALETDPTRGAFGGSLVLDGAGIPHVMWAQSVESDISVCPCDLNVKRLNL